MRAAQKIVPVLLLACGWFVPGLVLAQSIEVTADPVECIPIEDNSVAWATVEDNRPDTTTRLYFRRLNDQVEDFYFVEMHSAGDGRYWGIFPKAEDREAQRHDLDDELPTVQWSDEDDDSERRWAEWWRSKDASDHRDPNDSLDQDVIRERASIGKQIRRDWMNELDDRTFQEWLENQVNEPAEHFVAVVDGQGRFLAQTGTMVTEVRDPDDCEVEFTPQQAGERENLTVGETSEWQRGEPVFHWLCDGLVTRIDPFLVKRGDEVCRACVIAWWQRKGVLIPTAILATIPPGIIITETDPTPVSPSTP